MLILGPAEGLKLASLPDQVLGMDCWVDLGRPVLWGSLLVPSRSRCEGPPPDAVLGFSLEIIFSPTSGTVHLQYLTEPGVQ